MDVDLYLVGALSGALHESCDLGGSANTGEVTDGHIESAVCEPDRYCGADAVAGTGDQYDPTHSDWLNRHRTII
jgi:hypothetical protein